MPQITYHVVSPFQDDLQALIGKLDAELHDRYPHEGIFGLDFTSAKINEMTFAVAYCDSVPAGCGGIRPIDSETVELKRFFVDRRFRRQGIATGLLGFLESIAFLLGHSVIKLETGPEQPESIALYKKCGYYEIELFGEYCDSRYSFCMEKRLLSPQTSVASAQK